MTEHRWRNLRKGATLLYLEYGYGHTQLWADQAQARIGETLEIRLDLNRELRVRNKESNSYIDARELADGAIEDLKLVQVTDGLILSGLTALLAPLPQSPGHWLLTLLLQGERRFVVKPEIPRANPDTLFLRVESQ